MMSDSAANFVRGNHKLQRQMSRSPVFTQIKEKNSFVVDGQTEYIVAGDVSGTEEELYLDSLARGAQLAERKAGGKSLNGDEILFWQLFTELPADVQTLLQRRFK